MKKSGLIMITAACMMLFAASAVNAETVTSSDGVLSIELPAENWAQTTDPNYWFVVSDGKNTITVDHLSNGENLPSVMVANSFYPAVYQAFVSTENEVFVVKGLAATEEELESLMKTIGTIKVLKYDTKKAVEKAAAAPSADQYGLKGMNAIYYVASDVEELMVRGGYSTDSDILGTLYAGEEVAVEGMVTRNGEDYGWYKISYDGMEAYVNAMFLSTEQGAAASEAPATGAAASSGQTSAGSSQTVYTEDGRVTVITFDPAAGAWKDANGLTYLEMAGALLYDPVNDIYWDADPNFWSSHSNSDFNYNEFAQSMTDGGSAYPAKYSNMVTVYSPEGNAVDLYFDEAAYAWKSVATDQVYIAMAGGLYYQDGSDAYWDSDPTYWNDHIAPNVTVDNSGNAYGYTDDYSGDSMTVYKEDGSWMNIFYDSTTGTWSDAHGQVYAPAGGELFVGPDGAYWDGDTSN